jgi:hypothetical protein
MKKVLFMILLFIGAASMITSCKKEDKKQKVMNLLISSKWFYNSYYAAEVPSDTSDCFGDEDFFECKSNGTISDDEYFIDEGSTFTLSEDAKTITVTEPDETYTITLISIDETTLKFQRMLEGMVFEFILTKTADDCDR